VIGVLILLVGAGAVIAILATRNSGTNTVTTTIERVASPTVQTESEEEPVAETFKPETTSVETAEEPEPFEGEVEPEEPTGYPEVPRTAMNEEVASVLEGYHTDVVEEEFQAAWELLSQRKRRQNLRENGYREWAQAQASLSPYLDPYGLEAEIVSLEGEGVARVEVTGMGWSGPGAPCSEWSGLTWVKYEGGRWAYDPGYSTTAARRATWRPKSGRLLGGDCSG
jgi:hypothetical protein